MAYDIEIQVAASLDDVYVVLNNAAWGADADNERQGVGRWVVTENKTGGGMRFLNVAIPQGATIDQAFLSIYCRTSDSTSPVNSRITGEDVDDAIAFTEDINDYKARRGTVVGGANDDNITTAQVDWDNMPSWTAGTWYDSPDIKTIIQEIVNRPGWVSGQNIALFWDDHDGRSTTDDKVRRGRSYDYSGNITGPKLYVDFTVGWSGGDVGGVAIAAIASINGVALADIVKVNGVA